MNRENEFKAVAGLIFLYGLVGLFLYAHVYLYLKTGIIDNAGSKLISVAVNLRRAAYVFLGSAFLASWAISSICKSDKRNVPGFVYRHHAWISALTAMLWVVFSILGGPYLVSVDNGHVLVSFRDNATQIFAWESTLLQRGLHWIITKCFVSVLAVVMVVHAIIVGSSRIWETNKGES